MTPARGVLLLSVGVVGCDQARQEILPAPAASPPFTDVAEASGLRFTHENGAAGQFLLPEIMGAGGGFLDYDGDGWLDVYLVQSGRIGQPDASVANVLYRNNRGHFEEVTTDAGVGDMGYGMGCTAGDFDNDGHSDLYVTNFGPNVLYRNRGDGTFENVTDATGTGDPGWSTSAAFLDYDNDGDLDLFVTNYVEWRDTPAFTQRRCVAVNGAPDYCSPQAYDAPSHDTLYENLGDGTFRDISSDAGVRARLGTGLGVVCTDLNRDGFVDVYVANDLMPSFAWMNQGDGTFIERGATLGVAVDEMGKSQAGMGVASADIDGDGDFDLWKVHLHRESHILYLNHGHYFDDVTARWGLSAPTRPFTGFGTAMFDFDHDGLLDIFIANGRVQVVDPTSTAPDPYAERNQLFRQAEPGAFRHVFGSADSSLGAVENTRGAAFGDYDNDGDIDILLTNCNGPVRLLRNDAPKPGRSLTLRVLDHHGRDAYGALVTCTIDGVERVSEVRAAYSYCSTSDPRVHLGTYTTTRVERVAVRWVDGTTSEHGPFETGEMHVIRQVDGG